MRNHKYATTLVLQVGDAEVEYFATVSYCRHAGYAGDQTSPPEDAQCEVTGITLDFTATARFPLPDLIVAELQDQLQPELMEAWFDDDIAAAEYRAEQMRDDRMTDRLA